MGRKKIIVMVGTRSEVIKFSSIIRELKRNENFDLKILHTGQHETGNLMELLGLPEPDIYLGESQRKKWSKKGKIKTSFLAIKWLTGIFSSMRREIIRESPDAIFYQGNCMTVPMVVFAAKTVSKKIVLVHRESGIRTNNILEPFLGDLWEKIGDMFGDVLFAPSKVAEENLRKEKLKGKIYNAGDPHVEIVEYALKRGNVKESGQYVVVNVLHFENVTNENKMKNFVEILKRCPFKVIFPMTASVKGRLELFGLMKELEKYPNIVLTDPYNYVDFLKLIEKCEAVLTDSGGVQQESFILKIPCIFLGKINVWKEFEDRGIVISTGFDVKETLRVLDEIKNKGNFYKKVKAAKYPLGDGKATERIVKILERELVG